MFSVYDEASFHGNVDVNMNELLQARAENLTYNEMTVEQGAGRCLEGRLAFCTEGVQQGKFAFADGTKWVFVGDTSTSVNSLYKPNPAKVVSVSNITLAGSQTIDGVSVVENDLVLVKGQTSTAMNGVYVVGPGSAVWKRHKDTDTWDKLVSAMVVVEQGTLYKDTQWMCTIDKGGTLETTPITWLQIPLLNDIIARNGLTRTGNYLDVNPDVLNNTTKINASNQIEVKRSTTGAITVDSNATTGGLKANTDNTTIGINASNQLYAKNAIKSFDTFLNAGSPNITTGTGIVGGLIQNDLNIQINHNLGVRPLMIQFHSGDSQKNGGELVNIIHPEITAVSNTSLSVKFHIHDVNNLTGAVVETLEASKVHVSVIGKGVE